MTPTPPAQPRKVALITGGARRVGRAVALHFAARGYDLLVTYRSSKSDADTLITEATRVGSCCVALQADLIDDDAPDRIAQAARDLFGRLDLLLHNASVFPRATLEETPPQLIREVMKVHVEAPLLLTRELAPLLRATRGNVIAMTDIVADRPYAGYLAYSASKAALANLVLGLAKSLAPEVRVNAIAPGAVDWPEDMPEDARAAYLKKVPLARPGTPEDVARAAWYLAEEAPYVTGQTIRLDGGRGLV